jgi:hypothetical protein
VGRPRLVEREALSNVLHPLNNSENSGKSRGGVATEVAIVLPPGLPDVCRLTASDDDD